MKYSFMTFSCPGLSFDEVIECAQRFGYDGVEIRTVANHKHGVETTSDGSARKEIREKAERAGVVIACVATSCRFSDPETCADNVNAAFEHIKLAGDIGSKRIRVFGGTLPKEVTRESAIVAVSESLKKLSDAAEKAGVVVCIETHDSWCDPSHLAEVLENVNHPAIAANWDIMHPVRTAGKTMEEAFKILKPWIRHLHVHDGQSHEDGGKLLPIGEGVVDHKTAISLLKRAGYDEFISGEWIGWEPYEIHLPRELATMKCYEQEAS